MLHPNAHVADDNDIPMMELLKPIQGDPDALAEVDQMITSGQIDKAIQHLLSFQQ